MPNVLSPGDLVFRPDIMDETVKSSDSDFKETVVKHFEFIYEPRHEKTKVLFMPKQKRS